MDSKGRRPLAGPGGRPGLSFLRPRSPPFPTPRKLPPPAIVRIDRMGSEGDGVGRLPDGKPVYVPLTLPGELVLARPVRPIGDGWLAVAEAVEEPGEARIAPPCRHFDRCGGCVLQHWQDGAYRAWKV